MMKKLVTLASLLLVGCGDDRKVSDPQLVETDKTKKVVRPIDNAPAISLVFTRTRDDGWRKVETEIGGKLYTFHDDPLRYMLDANGEGFGDRAMLCGMSTPDVTDGTNLGITCAVADVATGLGPLHRITTPTSAWIGDVCVDGSGAAAKVTVLYSSGTRPIDPEAPPDEAPCLAHAWDPTTGWALAAQPSFVCACEMRDGIACDDPCFLGTGVRRDGVCDTGGLASACDDGDAATQDFCTGKAGELCYHERPL